MNDKIAELEATIKKAQEQIEDLKQQAVHKKWKPKGGESFWFISPKRKAEITQWRNDNLNEWNYIVGNCHSTREEAERWWEKQQVKCRLEEIAAEGGPLKGSNGGYTLRYDFYDEKVVIISWCSSRSDSTTHFPTEPLAQKAIDELGDRLLVLFDVE